MVTNGDPPFHYVQSKRTDRYKRLDPSGLVHNKDIILFLTIFNNKNYMYEELPR